MFFCFILWESQFILRVTIRSITILIHQVVKLIFWNQFLWLFLWDFHRGQSLYLRGVSASIGNHPNLFLATLLLVLVWAYHSMLFVDFNFYTNSCRFLQMQHEYENLWLYPWRGVFQWDIISNPECYCWNIGASKKEASSKQERHSALAFQFSYQEFNVRRTRPFCRKTLERVLGFHSCNLWIGIWK